MHLKQATAALDSAWVAALTFATQRDSWQGSLAYFSYLILLHQHKLHNPDRKMRLINCSTLQLKELFGSNIPRYAILSHMWGDEEVSFADFTVSQPAATRTNDTA